MTEQDLIDLVKKVKVVPEDMNKPMYLCYSKVVVDTIGIENMIEFIFKVFGYRMILAREEYGLCLFEEDKTNVLKEVK